MNGLTIGSLFSGIGGLELGLEWAGHGPVLWQVERDAYCQRVLAKHWPDVERYNDVCTVGAELAPVDIICGGFPCQDVSCAGKGDGISEGTRSGLWFEFARIVRLVRPRFVVVENVSALLARGLGIVLGDLATCGYDATWDCVPAAAVGAPHRRDRVFIVAYSGSEQLREQPRGERWACWPSALQLAVNGQAGDVADALREGLEGPQWTLADKGAELGGSGGLERRSLARRQAPTGFSWWSSEPDVGRVAHGVPARADRLRALGNAVVPQCAQVVGEVINQLRGAR